MLWIRFLQRLRRSFSRWGLRTIPSIQSPHGSSWINQIKYVKCHFPFFEITQSANTLERWLFNLISSWKKGKRIFKKLLACLCPRICIVYCLLVKQLQSESVFTSSPNTAGFELHEKKAGDRFNHAWFTEHSLSLITKKWDIVNFRDCRKHDTSQHLYNI